ncbi:MAG: hypothetical protein SGILL_009449, partial [Bacillariaceae sp.]
NIEEYMRFASASSPYLDETQQVAAKYHVDNVNEVNRTCTYLVYVSKKEQTNPNFAREATFIRTTMLKMTLSYDESYFKKVGVFLTPEYLDFVFGNILNTEQTRRYICGISEGCEETNVGVTTDTCLQELEALPITEGEGSYFDGNSFGCRALHAVFASTNNVRCPRISFVPQEDPNGKIKCQKSSNTSVYDFFDQQDIDDFYAFLGSAESITTSSVGFRILSMPKDVETPRRFWVGLVTPLCLFLATFFLLRRNAPKEEQEEEDNLFQIKARRLWIMVWILILALVVAFGLAAMVIQAIARNNTGWDQDDDSKSSLRGTYLGLPGVAQETVPQTVLSDEQFAVYSGFIVWMTVMIAGLGLELFVWHHFLQCWCEIREGLWRFAQFIFPLLAVITLGLAFHQNFLSFLFLVICLWKFGFPETFTYLNLALFDKKVSQLSRMADFLNAIGTVLHHGAASFIISMLTVG